jgi:hypothetical protein
MILVNLRKLNSLVATYKDSASTEAEKESSRNLVCKMIEKETGCPRWVSANIFDGLVEGEIFINKHKQDTINKWNKSNYDVIKVLRDTINKIGLVCCIFDIRVMKEGNRMKKIVM